MFFQLRTLLNNYNVNYINKKSVKLQERLYNNTNFNNQMTPDEQALSNSGMHSGVETHSK